jgi:hypothetical protein
MEGHSRNAKAPPRPRRPTRKDDSWCWIWGSAASKCRQQQTRDLPPSGKRRRENSVRGFCPRSLPICWVNAGQSCRRPVELEDVGVNPQGAPQPGKPLTYPVPIASHRNPRLFWPPGPRTRENPTRRPRTQGRAHFRPKKGHSRGPC